MPPASPKPTITGTGALAVVSGSFLSGTMMSLSLLAVPVFLSTTTSPTQLLREWARMYALGHQVLPSISVATMVLYSYTAYTQRVANKRWKIFVAAGVTTVLMLPFTWFIMAPTNGRLFALEAAARMGGDGASWEAVKGLVGRWRLLHLCRSLFPLGGALLGLGGLWE
ncbi:DUF1772-domain-containing protein [Trematosphaeria pertusa]|uniref:DUF1772-domain-containing protein n=1 Tax=Trematosphaeria pertusa TaxID=390896 RepID=A0A6A6I4Z9_9PLEO|nr:DUF1772-domain-containing protein [Trematosphaeria pertusa]KAF2245585.1 DUF1772-domain-containing protein [Trematosphaeria pertusa]